MRKYLYNGDSFIEKSTYQPGYWVCVECPDDSDNRFLTDTLHVPQSFLDDLSDADELPRIETEDGWLLAILRIPIENPEGGAPFITVPMGVMSKQGVMVSVCYHASDMQQLIEKVSQRKNVNIRNHIDLILRIVYASTDRYLKDLQCINYELENSEHKLQKSILNEDLLQLRNLQKTLVYFNVAVKGNQMMTERLGTLYQQTDGLDIELLEDVKIELKQAFNTINVYTEILNGTMDSYTSIISNNLNVIMKRMTSFSIALMIPTGIASFYGMNLVNHIENSAYAFWIIVGASIVLSVLSIVWFRKIKWF